MKYRKIFKIDAEGDTVYVNADNEKDAKARLHKIVGPMPDDLLTITEVEKLPEGEEFL